MRRKRWQVYKDFYGRIKIAPLEVCAEPQWLDVGGFWFCVKQYFYWRKVNKGVIVRERE